MTPQSRLFSARRIGLRSCSGSGVPLINTGINVECQEDFNPPLLSQFGRGAKNEAQVRASDLAPQANKVIDGGGVFENLLETSLGASSMWESRQVKKVLSNAEQEWLASLRSWKIFASLTFRDPIPPDVADRYFRRLVQLLNVRAFGKHYVKKFGHSYFSYVQALEFQRRDVVHFHFLADAPINFDLVHKWWGAAAGWAWIDQVRDEEKALEYVSKYIVKGGRLKHHLRDVEPWPPNEKPAWWP